MMTNSEKKQLLNKLNDAIKEQEHIRYSVLSFVTSIINRDNSLSVKQKTNLLDQIWRGEDEKE